MTTAEAATRMPRAFGLTGEGWQRHANPWSVYTRIPIPALIALAVWSRDWIGWWSLLPIGLVCVWTAINPRVFPRPRSMDHWASRAVLGEVFWTGRKTVPIPVHHRTAANVLISVNSLGLPFIVWGLVVFDAWMVIAGLVVHMAGKNWFMDRMVWLYDDMTRSSADSPSPTTDAAAAKP